MSKSFNLWVLTRNSNKINIETWINKNPSYKNITFIYYDMPYFLRFWKKGLRGVRIYYNFWQLLTNKIVKKTMIQNNIKIYHHLTYGNSLWPVSSYGKKQFFIWGPVGGCETISFEFSKHYDLKGMFIEIIRKLVVKSLVFNIPFRNRCKYADLILCKTENQKSIIPTKYRHKAILFTDVAVNQTDFKYSKKNNLTNNHVNFVVVGRLDPWRGFDLLIESFELALKKTPNLLLTIVGDGMDYKRLNKMILARNLSKKIIMTGKVSHSEYQKIIMNSHVVVNPSLREGAVTTAFDSMAIGKPLICIDTTGYTRYFNDNYAIVIKMQSRKLIIKALKNAIIKLSDKNQRNILGKKAKNAGKQFTWDKRGYDIVKTIKKWYSNSKF